MNNSLPKALRKRLLELNIARMQYGAKVAKSYGVDATKLSNQSLLTFSKISCA